MKMKMSRQEDWVRVVARAQTAARAQHQHRTSRAPVHQATPGHTTHHQQGKVLGAPGHHGAPARYGNSVQTLGTATHTTSLSVHTAPTPHCTPRRSLCTTLRHTPHLTTAGCTLGPKPTLYTIKGPSPERGPVEHCRTESRERWQRKWGGEGGACSH